MFKSLKAWLPFLLIIVGVLCGAAFLVVFLETGGPRLSRGAPITSNGYGALIASGLGFLGLTGSGFYKLIIQKVAALMGLNVSDAEIAEVVECGSAMTNYVAEKFSKASTRRLYYAGIELLASLDGATVTQDPDGSIKISFSDLTGIPASPSTQATYFPATSQGVVAPLQPFAPQLIAPQPIAPQPIAPQPAPSQPIVPQVVQQQLPPATPQVAAQVQQIQQPTR